MNPAEETKLPREAALPTTPPEPQAELSEAALASAKPYIGEWNQLVTTTNWEKGRIIAEWRSALEEQEAQVTEYSDEAWAKLVGGVTSQHVGRLRRAHERFGSVREQYAGLYWSHFQAALDWDDAEMWLEGAVENKWSVSQLRAARWEATGNPAEGPTQGEVVETQIDEDAYQSFTDTPPAPAPSDSDTEASESTERAESAESDSEPPFDPMDEPTAKAEATPRVQPFKDLAALPDDVTEAFEQFKLVILSHKLTGWESISRDDLLGALDSLKELALAPSDES